jgi:hypothetical protein
MADDDSANSRWKKSKTAGGLRSAGASLIQSGQDELDRSDSDRITPSSFKKGGRVKARKAKRKAKPRY